MISPDVIRIEGVTKQYPVFEQPWRKVRYLARTVCAGIPARTGSGIVVHALSGVTFSVARGERVGIVGRNGAGKSTLLRLLAGNFPPTAGRIGVEGSIYCLFPGSVSFSLEQSVEENARQHLALLPIAAREMEARLDDIREFTELGEYFTQPARNLSLGMRVRAEFAVATASTADIIIIDEVLGAGDIYWADKIARRMERMCEHGSTLLLVSHSLPQINRFCERVIWIERGKAVMDGPALEVTKRYEGFLERLSWQTDDLDDKTIVIEQAAAGLGNEILQDSGQTVTRWPGRGDVRVTGVWINGEAVTRQTTGHGQPLLLRLMLRARQPGEYHLRYTFTFWDENGGRMAVLENESDTARFDDETSHEAEVTCRLPISAQGEFDVSVTVTDSLEAGNTSSESVIRLDALYKSFRIRVIGTDALHAPGTQPIFRLYPELERAS